MRFLEGDGERARGNALGGEHPVQLRTAVFESDTTREASLTEFSSADAEMETTDYPVPWDIVITGLLAGGLTVLIGAVLASQRRLRP